MEENRTGYLGDLDAASERIPTDVPYVMMNMVKFRPVAEYPASFHHDDDTSKSLSGSEVYTIYRQTFAKRAAEMGITSAEVLFLGRAHTNIIAGQCEGESWDLVLLVRFESFAQFRSVLEDKFYLDHIQPHRLAAVEDFRSFAVTEVSI